MKIESFEQRILTATEGHFLYNEQAKSITDKVWLAKEADINDWVEIDESKKLELEALWKKDSNEQAKKPL